MSGAQQHLDLSSGSGFLSPLSDEPFSPTSTWNAQLTRRQRVLLHMEPILRLYRQPGTRDERHLRYDSLALVMKVFDTIIDQSGFGSEVTDETVIIAVKPLLRAWDEASGRAPEAGLHEEVLARILAELKNEGQRQEPFEVPYQAFDGEGCPKDQVLRFKLLVEQFGYEGGIVLRLSSEAINLFLNAFGLDIEDAQVANEAVVQSQLERGRYNEAVQSAQNAHGQSMRFEEKVRLLLLQITRDIDRVDWRGEADELLREALAHVGSRLHVEDNIMRSAQDKVDSLNEDDTRRSALAEVIRLMKDCHQRHLLLHKRLMPARGEYMRQQARQAFVARSLREPVDLRDSVLRDLLQQPAGLAAELLERHGGVFAGPQAPALLNLRELVHWQLMPKRQMGGGLAPVEELVLAQGGYREDRFPDAAVEEAGRALGALEARARLSELIGEWKGRVRPLDVVDALVMQVMRTFGDEAENAGYRVELAERSGLRCRRHFGDDLWVTPDREEVHRADSP